MAYNRRYNPDALPAFAEPERPNRTKADSTASSNRPDTDRYATKPPPAPPSNVQTLRNDDSARRPSPSAQAGYKSPTTRPPPGAYDARWDDRTPPGRGSGSSGGYGGGGGGGPGSRHNSYENSGYRRGDDRYGSRDDRYGPPPPANDARGRSGTAGSVRPPRDANDRDALWPMFRAVDREQTGQLSEAELGRALVNGDYTSFDPHTVRMMIRMFDVDRSGTISFDEFCGLWGFLSEWRKLFDRFDVDHSGTISFDEFTDALVAFGYRLSTQYVQLLFNTYDSKQRGVLSFDLFVQACISLKRMTDVFKKYDTDRDGYITLSFEEFLTGSQSLFLFNSISPSTDRRDAY